MSSQPICITLKEQTIKNLDKIRGLTKRSTIIESIISQYLDKNGVGGHNTTSTPKTSPSRQARGNL